MSEVQQPDIVFAEVEDCSEFHANALEIFVFIDAPS